MNQFRIPATMDQSGQYDRHTHQTDPTYRNEKPVFRASEKVKNDYAYAKAKFEYWYTFLIGFDKKDKDKYQINYELAAGLGNKYMTSLKQPISEVLRNEGTVLPFEEVIYVDYLSPIIKAMSGAQRRKSLKYHVTDEGPFGYNQYMETKNDQLKQALNQQAIEPARQLLMAELQQQHPELFEGEAAKDPKRIQEIQQQIESGVHEQVYSGIFEYMDKEYRNDTALSSQLLLKALERDTNLKFKTDEGYKLIFPTGREVFRVVSDYVLDVKLCDPAGFYVYAPKNNIFFQDATSCMYEEECDIYQVIAEFSRELGPKKIQEFEDEIWQLLDGITNTSISDQVIGFVEYDEVNPDFKDNMNVRTGRFGGERVNTMTPEGQQKAINNSVRYSQFVNTRFKKVHLCWRENRLTKVFRTSPDPNTTEWHLVDEHFAYDETIHYEVKQEVIEELWEVDAFGFQGKWFFLRNRPIPNQYGSSTDYKKPKFQYKGADFNNFLGNTVNVAPLDNAKSWVFKACLHSYYIDEAVATDIGPIIVGNSAMKPKRYTDKDWKQNMKINKFLDVDTSKEGSNGLDMQYLFQVRNLSRTADHQAKLNYQQYLEGKILQSIGFSPERLAQISPYMPAANVNNAINLSNLQNADVDIYHAQIVEQVLNDLLDAAIVFLSKNSYKQMVMLPDLSQVALEMDWEKVKRSTLRVHAVIDPDLDARLQQLQQYVLQFAGGGFLDFTEIIEVIWNPEYQFLKELARRAEKRKAEKEQQAQEFERQMQAAKDQAMKEQLAIQHAQNMEIQKEVTSREIRKEDIRSTLMQKGYDVDQDNQNDLLEVQQLKTAAEERMHQTDVNLEKWYREVEHKLKNKELDIKAKQPKKK